MKTIIMIVAAGAVLVFLYLNPTFFNGLIDHVKKPVDAWVKNPDKAFEDYAPWQLDPEDLKKKSGQTGDPVLDKKDTGNSVKTKDPGNQQKTQDPGKNITAADPGKNAQISTPKVYVNKNDPGQKWKVGSDPGQKFVIEESSTAEKKKDSKKEASPKDLRYTQDEFNVYAVAVQKAK